jgi:murein L,D-transpeptidase YcbB/YkuD
MRRQLLSFTILLAVALSPALAGEQGSSSISDQQTTAVVGLAPEINAALSPAGARPSGTERDDRAALAKFYESRQFEPAWVTPAGVSPAGRAIMAELGKADDWGLEASAFRLPKAPTDGAQVSRAERANFDVALGLTVLKYARHARGGRMDPTALSKYIDRKPPLADPAKVIEEAAKADQPDAYLRSLHPQHPQFERLRQKYLAAKAGGQPLTQADTAAPSGAKKDAAPDAPLAKRLLVNMEEWRWMPVSLGDFYVWVNVPEFTLRVVKNGQVVHTERVVAGKPDTPTPIFSQNMEQVIFHPNWGVPESIKKADVLPSLIRGSTRIFTFYHLKIQRGGRDVDPSTVDWSTADIRQFHVYQPPGENNVLGNIKFRFPNKHDVYMHDTPQKQLFNADVRAFSHGCMRVRNPQKLAELLLAEDQGWPAQRTASAFATGAPQNNQVNLGRKIPVHITYFTAAVSDDGKLKLFPDVYNHESKIALGMEGKAHLIPKEKAPVTAEPGLAESRGPGYAKKDLVHQVFGNN